VKIGSPAVIKISSSTATFPLELPAKTPRTASPRHIVPAGHSSRTMVFILAETAAGYAIFKAKDKALKNPKTLADDLANVENATSMYDSCFSGGVLSWC